MNLRKRRPRQESYDGLEREAAEFFSIVPKADRTEALAFQAAALKSIARESVATPRYDIGDNRIARPAQRHRGTRRPVPRRPK